MMRQLLETGEVLRGTLGVETRTSPGNPALDRRKSRA